MCAVGRHRAEHEGDADKPLDQPTAWRKRIWANPAGLAALGLVGAIAAVFGGWAMIGQGEASPVVYPWTTVAPTPIDISVTLVPPPVDPSGLPSPAPAPVNVTSKSPAP